MFYFVFTLDINVIRRWTKSISRGYMVREWQDITPRWTREICSSSVFLYLKYLHCKTMPGNDHTGVKHLWEITFFWLFTTPSNIRYGFLLSRRESFNGKYTTRQIHTKLFLETEWGFVHNFTNEDIDDVISRFLRVVWRFQQSLCQ